MSKAATATAKPADSAPGDSVKPMAPKNPFLKQGSAGPAVAVWRGFLRDQGFALPDQPADLFDEACDAQTRAFQEQQGLEVDGKVGDETWRRARKLTAGLKIPGELPDPDFPVPPTPPLAPFLTDKRRAQLYTAPADWEVITPGQDEVRFTGGWEEANITGVLVPQLRGIRGAPNSGMIRFHGRAAHRLVSLFKAWEEAGLLAQLLTFDGAFNARMIRGDIKPKADPRHPKALSNHAFGLAFDINARFNGLGEPPARRGQAGCVYDLVPIAWKHGFYWGGNFQNRPDGMHFEVGDVPVE
jgi:peptidoglycan hydrolase-like protein with peptidoglycan-binding domain